MKSRIMTPAETDRLRVLAVQIIDAVDGHDIGKIRAVYRDIEATFQVDGPHAVVMVLADQILTERRQHRLRLAYEQGETLRFQTEYLDQKRRVSELRAILDRSAAAKPSLKGARTA